MTLLIWWYLVAYDLGNPFRYDNVIVGITVAEYQTLEDCTQQQKIYYLRSPQGFARCEGSKFRQDFKALNRSLEKDARRRLEIPTLKKSP